MRLLEALPPERLLFLHQLPPDPAVAELIGQVVSSCLTYNTDYYRDVLAVWQRHSAFPLESVGHLRHHYANKVAARLDEQLCPQADIVHVKRLLRLFAVYSKHTTLSRSGDLFVRCSVASVLPDHVSAGLGVTETPYHAAADVLQEDYNQWVGQLFKTPLQERFSTTQWRSSVSCVDACFLFALAFECLVTEKQHRVLLPHELAYDGQTEMPTVVLLEKMPCVCWHATVWRPPEGSAYPLFHLLVLWIQLAAISGADGVAVLNLCFARPEAVGSRDPIHATLQESIRAGGEESVAVLA